MKNICKNCGKEYEFEPKRGTYKFVYCSDKCKKEYNIKDNLPQYRICQYCGKEYWWDGTIDNYKDKMLVDSKKFCSYDCGKNYKYDKVRKTTLEHYGAIGWAVKEIMQKTEETKLKRYNNKNFNNRTKAKETCLEKYGVEIISQSKEIQQKVSNTWKNKTEDELQTITNKRKETSLEKYGTESPSQSIEIKQKILDNWKNKTEDELQAIKDKSKKACLEKYGVECYSKTDECKEKIKETCLEKYGVESYLQTEEKQEKSKKTCLEKYGTEYAQQSDKIKNKIKQTNLERYGASSAIQSKLIQDKIKAKNLEKYGTEYAIGSKEIQKKIRETNLEKYNYEYPFQSKELRLIMEENRKKTNIKKYGTPNIIQVPEFKEKAKQACLEKYGVEYNCLSKNCIDANSSTVSRINLNFKEKLDKLNINNSIEFKLKNKSYDFLINDNLLLEINPTYTHQSTCTLPLATHVIIPREPYYHFNKYILAKTYGYNCIQIWDWDDIEKIINMLKEKEVMYARNLTIGNVSDKECNEFLDKYHLQNSCNGQDIKLGLYKNSELIEIMTFSKPRYNKNYEYELLRLCTKAEYKVIGGASKLFKYFIKEYKPASIISYCDNAKFTGEVYKRLGMKLEDKGKPSKHWFNIDTKRHITDNLLRQRGYSQLHNDTEHKKGESNEQLMLEAGYLEVYDCGQSTYTWKNKNL